MRKFVIGLACFLAAACQTSAPEPAPAPFYTLTDLTDEYTAFYDRTQGMEGPARVAAFKAAFDPLFPGFYQVARLRGVTQEAYDARIAASFDAFPALRERYTAAAANFETMMEPARASFAHSFPDVQPIGQVYLVHSLGEMDGGRRSIANRRLLIFGADVMARVHTFANEQPFFHHELFHVYHAQYFEGCRAIWCGLWGEGLAVHVAETLNPGASDDQLLLSMPQPIRPAVDARRSEAVCAVRARMNSEAPEDYAPLFRGDTRLSETLPARFGYYVGLLVAREAGRARTLRELAQLSVEEARPIVAEALASLAPECPAAN